MRVKTMRATRTARTGRAASRRTRRPVKRVSAKRTAVKAKPVRPVKAVIVPPEPGLYKLCKPGWSGIVERIPNAQGTTLGCPFCPKAHPAPGPARGVKKKRGRGGGGRHRRAGGEKEEIARP